MLNKKDPLLDVVTGVMSESDATRMAIEAANKHFGVTSRKALPHELHEAYDKMVVDESVKFYAKGNETRPKKDSGDKEKVTRFKNALEKAPPIRKTEKGETVHESAETLEEGERLAALKAALISGAKTAKETAGIGLSSGAGVSGMLHLTGTDPVTSIAAGALTAAGAPVIDALGTYRDERKKDKKYANMLKQNAARRKISDASLKESNSVFDEIRINILNEMATITDEEKLMSYIDNLSEEQMDILGLAEASDKKKPEAKQEGGLVEMPKTSVVPKPAVSTQERQDGAAGAAVSARPATGQAAAGGTAKRAQTRATTPRK